MQIDSMGKPDDWNALGIIEAGSGKRTHARQRGGIVVKLNNGVVYVEGKPTAAKFSRGVQQGDVIRVTHNPISKRVTFQLNQTAPVAVTHTLKTVNIRPVFAARDIGWAVSLLPSFLFSNESKNNTKPSLYTLTTSAKCGSNVGFLNAKKNTQDQTIYNVSCVPEQTAKCDFSFAVKFTNLVKADQYNSIGIVSSTHDHLRVKNAVCM
jgi:hypothetical protein